MDRRNALASLSGLATTAVLFTTVGRPAFSATGKTLDESAYKAQTLTVGTLSKLSSTMALVQGANPKVKEFAQFEINEQTTMAQVLTHMANPPPAMLDPNMQAHLTQLQTMTGKAFDAAYLEVQLDGHHRLYTIQQEFLDFTPTDMDREHIAMLARTVIQMHLTMIQDIQNIIGA
jgi:predicted outer membrane protein